MRILWSSSLKMVSLLQVSKGAVCDVAVLGYFWSGFTEISILTVRFCGFTRLSGLQFS